MVKLWLECRKWFGGGGGHASAPPSRPGTPSAHPGARILRTRSKPTDFLNQKVGKYGAMNEVFA